MKAGWYIVNYHNVDWEDSLLTRVLGGAVSPDIFRSHLKIFLKKGELISVQEGLRRLATGIPFRKPAFSIWFDDGYRCVRTYALPVCREFGITCAVSVCSRMALRQEMFWYAKVSYLSFVDGVRLLRSRFRRFGYDQSESMRGWLLRNFNQEINDAIEEVYTRCSNEVFRRGAWKIFDDAEGLAELHKSGWVLANHSAGHYPLSDSHSPGYVREQFIECDRFLDSLKSAERFYVVPFEYAEGTLTEGYCRKLGLDGFFVKKQERINSSAAYKERILYRYTPITEYRAVTGVPIAALNTGNKIRFFLEKLGF